MTNFDTDFAEIRKEVRKKQAMKAAALMIICLVAFVLVIFGGILAWRWINEDGLAAVSGPGMDIGEEVIFYTQQEMEERAQLLAEEKKREMLQQLAETLSTGSTMVEALRPLYQEELVVVSGGRYHFVPVSDSLKKHGYVQENLRIAESGELSYMENGQVITHKGIDVSRYNGEIDWSKVAADGVEFAFIRAGYRGYGTQGRLVEDEYFKTNVENALTNGVKVGVYFFTQATTEAEAVEEAEMVKQMIAPYDIQCPVVYDVEKVSDSQGRMNKISVEERTRMALTFCQTIEAAGYTPMIYHNLEMGALMLDLTQLEAYDKWFAYYNEDIYYPYDFKVWQYTDEGRVDGIQGDVDLNIAFEKIWE